MNEEMLKVKTTHHCGGENCGRDFVYGMLVVRSAPREGSEREKARPAVIYCENCARKNRISGQAVVFGGGDPNKVSSVTLDRARRKLKKLARLSQRSATKS